MKMSLNLQIQAWTTIYAGAIRIPPTPGTTPEMYADEGIRILETKIDEWTKSTPITIPSIPASGLDL
jgi:hypothetical protein